MRLMDGLMAIPGDPARDRAGLAVPRRVAERHRGDHRSGDPARPCASSRSIVLSVREEPYVEAAIMAGTRTPLLLGPPYPAEHDPGAHRAGNIHLRQRILIEAICRFSVSVFRRDADLGNIMAEGRGLFRIYPHNIFFPGICLALTVLAVNVLGDGLRDRLDPKLARRM
jgi:peptide/nickel transport system permease protein